MQARVLVVDDEIEFTRLVAYHLQEEGYEVLTAHCGSDALVQARRHLPDVILLDLMLPDLDGFEVSDILRHQSSTRDIPIVLVTAMASEVARGHGLNRHAEHCLSKPLRPESLLSCVRQVVRDRNARLEANLAAWEDPTPNP